jgi:hypothetical protein
MTRYSFDPSRLRGSAKQQEQAGYAVAGRMLREHLGGDVLAEVRRRVRSDPAVPPTARRSGCRSRLSPFSSRTTLFRCSPVNSATSSSSRLRSSRLAARYRPCIRFRHFHHSSTVIRSASGTRSLSHIFF